MEPDYSQVPNGIRRNLVKLKYEGGLWLNALQVGVSRLGRALVSDPKDILHAYTDIYVECRRISPYFSGHVAAFVVPAAVAFMIVQGI